SVELGIAITEQEAWTKRGGLPVRIPDFVAEVIERVAFEARCDKRVDKRSGVSQRMPISVLEIAISNAERRTAYNGECEVVPRLSDIYAASPAITGKMELEYEGELVGGQMVASDAIRRAADATFSARAGGVGTDNMVMWFDEGNAMQVTDDAETPALLQGFERVPGLLDLVYLVGLATEGDAPSTVAACELVLEALVARKQISRSDAGRYARAPVAERRRPGGGGQDLFGGGAIT
ncbi:MAG: magnesium chelatase, partial [Gemmatimonadaceae bacterium]